MKRILPLVLFCFFSLVIEAAHIPKVSKNVISISQFDDLLLVGFQRSSDLVQARKIELFDMEGIRKFQGTASSEVSVSGVNLSMLSEGEYIVRVQLEDQVVEQSFIKY